MNPGSNETRVILIVQFAFPLLVLSLSAIEEAVWYGPSVHHRSYKVAIWTINFFLELKLSYKFIGCVVLVWGFFVRVFLSGVGVCPFPTILNMVAMLHSNYNPFASYDKTTTRSTGNKADPHFRRSGSLHKYKLIHKYIHSTYTHTYILTHQSIPQHKSFPKHNRMSSLMIHLKIFGPHILRSAFDSSDPLRYSK